VEDLIGACKAPAGDGGCPYYTSHILAGNAEIVFCPHNYIMDPAVSQCGSHHRGRWSLRGRVIIIDEAHNLEQGCRDAGSVEVSLVELRQLSSALTALPTRHRNLRVRVRGQDVPCADVCAELVRVPQRLAAFLEQQANAPQASVPLAGLRQSWGLGQSTAGTAECLRAAGLTEHGLLGRAAEELAVELTDVLLRLQVEGRAVPEDAVVLGVLDRIRELLAKLQLTVRHPSSYVMGISSSSTGSSGSSSGPSIAAWLMAPGVIFESFAAKAHAVLLASGTLAPIAGLSAELSTSAAFVARSQPEGPLEAVHVVEPVQVLVSTVARFPGSGRVAVSSFGSWQDGDFLDDLGSAIASLAEAIPAGVLCFFPSYAAMDSAVSAWQGGSRRIWERLQRAKGDIQVEPRSSERLAEICSAYTGAARKPRGALCFAVYRGKVSEGLSFEDDLCRGVVCIGVPFPQARDPMVIAKRLWNDSQRVQGAGGAVGTLSGEQWYELQAYRAVNQALGRCVRHLYDYGALILLDARWSSKGDRSRGLRRYLARWLQPLVEEWPRIVASNNAEQTWRDLGDRLRIHFDVAPREVRRLKGLGDGASQASASQISSQISTQTSDVAAFWAAASWWNSAASRSNAAEQAMEPDFLNRNTVDENVPPGNHQGAKRPRPLPDSSAAAAAAAAAAARPRPPVQVATAAAIRTTTMARAAPPPPGRWWLSEMGPGVPPEAPRLVMGPSDLRAVSHGAAHAGREHAEQGRERLSGSSSLDTPMLPFRSP